MADELATPPSPPAEGKPPPSRTDKKAFESLQLTSPFTEAPPVADFVRNAIQAVQFWDHLGEAIRAETGADPALGTKPPFGVIRADNPILGLAGASLLGHPHVLVPITARERSWPTLDDLTDAVGVQTRLSEWLDSLAGIGASGLSGPLLLRGWDIRYGDLLKDFVEAESRLRAEAAQGALFLLKSSPADGEDDRLPCLLNVSERLLPIISRTLHSLKLPRFEPCASVEEAEALVRRLITVLQVSAALLIRSLNTPEHEQFERLAMRLRLQENPQTSQHFETIIFDQREAKPRHAASLFLVSHFRQLSPGHVMELGDLLASQTPAMLFAETQARPPLRLTDLVLQECGIHFVRSSLGASVARLFLDEGPRSTDRTLKESILPAEIIRRSFDTDAALLKERYLAELAVQLTLGHASHDIAVQFQDLEIEILGRMAGADRPAAKERLRRIVFGYPALVQAQSGFLDANRHRVTDRFMRAIKRAPALIRELADKIPDLAMDEMVGALCSATPVDADTRWVEAFHYGTIRLFWSVFAQFPTRVTLLGLPALFDRTGEFHAHEVDQSRARRQEALRVLAQILDRSEADPLIEGIAARFREPKLLEKLLRETADHYFRFADDGGPTLLLAAARQYATAALRERTWREVPAWSAEADLVSLVGAAGALGANDKVLAEALFADSMQRRLWPSSLRAERLVRQQAGQAAPEDLWDQGKFYWQIARFSIEGLIGVARFANLEDLAIEIWLVFCFHREALMNFSADSVDMEWFASPLLWMRWLDPELADRGPFDICFTKAVGPLLRLFPLLLLMAATRQDGAAGEEGVSFSFSQPLQQWLMKSKGSAREAPSESAGTPADTVQKTSEAAVKPATASPQPAEAPAKAPQTAAKHQAGPAEGGVPKPPGTGEWRPQPPPRDSWAHHLLEIVDGGIRFQDDWRMALGRCHLSVRDGRAVQRAAQDRMRALRAFKAALVPLVRASAQRPFSVNEPLRNPPSGDRPGAPVAGPTVSNR